MTDRIPELTTARLVLRALRQDDLDAYAAMVADPQVTRFLGAAPPNPPLDRAQAWRSLATFRGGWALQGFGQWALEERATGAFVGRAGLWRPPDWPGLEVGWALAPAAWRRGYATEAGAAAVAWAREELGAGELISIVSPDNVRSIAVAERLGFVRDPARPFGSADVYVNSGRPSSGVEAWA